MTKAIWTPKDVGTDRERFEAELNGFKLEVWLDDSDPSEEPSWCWKITDADGNQDGDTADGQDEAMEIAEANAR